MKEMWLRIAAFQDHACKDAECVSGIALKVVLDLKEAGFIDGNTQRISQAQVAIIKSITDIMMDIEEEKKEEA